MMLRREHQNTALDNLIEFCWQAVVCVILFGGVIAYGPFTPKLLQPLQNLGILRRRRSGPLIYRTNFVRRHRGEDTRCGSRVDQYIRIDPNDLFVVLYGLVTGDQAFLP